MENKSKRLDDGGTKRASVLFQDFQNLQRIWTAPRVLRYNSDKYEIEQQKRRDMNESDEESIGSIKDFIDDEDSESSGSGSSSSGTESDDEGSIQSINSDEPLKKIKKKKKESKDDKEAKDGPIIRRTRANAENCKYKFSSSDIRVFYCCFYLLCAVADEPEPELERRKENPTEWWMQICPEEELDNLEHSSKLILLMEILEQCEAIGDKL
jgi:transcriptional regulator ATRX